MTGRASHLDSPADFSTQAVALQAVPEDGEAAFQVDIAAYQHAVGAVGKGSVSFVRCRGWLQHHFNISLFGLSSIVVRYFNN